MTLFPPSEVRQKREHVRQYDFSWGNATIDALHRSLEQHEDHPDQYHQVLLALGGLGRMLDRGHPQQERIRATLEHRFDRALAANQETETRFLRHLDRARDLIESMPTEEWHMWMLRANHVDRREWAETWDTATPLDRQEYERHTTEVIARILAGAEGEDDGGKGTEGGAPRKEPGE